MSDSYKTVSSGATGELEEKKSRFIASLVPVTDEEQAIAHINRIKSENRKARHNVYAYILREGNISRYSDDGEPQGTGGVPVLEVLKGEGLTDVCVVVTRYFGGILLGTGGLARAYSGACKSAVENARIMEICRCSRFVISCGYDLYGKIDYILPEFGAKKLSEDFTDSVTLTVIVRSESAEAFREKLTDASNGKVVLEETPDIFEDLA
ncbi:MAG: YigZ family protein [Ruminococcus sp.]|nr:YigZ family protein [Ruminococcus sp.]